jgi:hypothetical protein
MEYFQNYNPVTLEEAKKLKALGYSEKCYWYYLDREDIPHVSAGLKYCDDHFINHNEFDDFVYSAPSKSDPVVIGLLE